MRSGSVFAAGAAAATLFLVAGDAAAQSHARTLADGRTLTVPASITNCRRLAGVTENNPAELALEFACQAPSEEGGPADTPGEAALVVLGEAAAVTPDAFLAGQLDNWWPGMDAASVAMNLTRSRKATANGEVAVVCVHRDDVEALAGDAVCVFDQRGLQVVVAGRSTMALTADNAVDTLLKGVTLR
jgi:hypothetical protein